MIDLSDLSNNLSRQKIGFREKTSLIYLIVNISYLKFLNKWIFIFNRLTTLLEYDH